jgi:hypothetical protein
MIQFTGKIYTHDSMYRLWIRWSVRQLCFEHIAEGL